MDSAVDNLIIRSDCLLPALGIYSSPSPGYHPSPPKYSSIHAHTPPRASDTACTSVLLKLKPSRVIKLWSPPEEAMLLSFYGYFRNSWSLYLPYFHRTISSLKMKCHSLSRSRRGLAGSDTVTSMDEGRANHASSSLLITNRLEAMRYIERLEAVTAGNPALALQLMRICGTPAELDQFTKQFSDCLQGTDMLDVLSSMPPLRSGGAPAGFGAGIAYRQESHVGFNSCSTGQRNMMSEECPTAGDPLTSPFIGGFPPTGPISTL